MIVNFDIHCYRIGAMLVTTPPVIRRLVFNKLNVLNEVFVGLSTIICTQRWTSVQDTSAFSYCLLCYLTASMKVNYPDIKPSEKTLGTGRFIPK